MPFAAGLLQVIGLGFLLDETTETTLLMASAVIALASLAGGCRHHGRFAPLAWVVGGFSLILIARRWLHSSELVEAMLVTSGALVVAGAHVVNSRLCCSSMNHDCVGRQRVLPGKAAVAELRVDREPAEHSDRLRLGERDVSTRRHRDHHPLIGLTDHAEVA
jgi:hypothetical protein